MPFRRCCRAGVLTAAIAVLASCTTRSARRFERLSNSTLANDFHPAIESIKKHPNLYGKNSLFLYHMDIGALYHYAGDFDSSTGHLLKAADVFDRLFARSVTNEAAAIMTNDNIRPYRSRPYELVMLHQFLACNYLAVGNVDDALVETRRVQLFFNEWNRKNKSDLKYDSDGMFHYLSSISYDAAGETSDAMISLFHAVKAFQAGPVPLPAPLRDRAYYMFQINDRENDNQLLQLKPELPRDKITGLANGVTEIIFIGYAGRGPVIEEKSWWGTWVKDGLLVVHHTGPDGEQETITLPAPPLPAEEMKKAEKGGKTESGTTFHIKFALPEVRTIPSLTKEFTVRCSGRARPATSIVINDLDRQAIKNLEDTRGTTLARTVVRVVLRTIAAQTAKKQMQTESAAANLLLNIGTDLLADQLEKADTRSCFLLPKTVQIVRLPVKPGIYSVDVEAREANGSVISSKSFTDIAIRAREKKFVFYPSFR
ncbi:MAG: hypothetical protein JW913_02265 [Chitinispirillaceae bacterium]|nr:hypothetical protein [Chitinispirillaceae bacterium]